MDDLSKQYQGLAGVYEALRPKEEILEQRPFFEQLTQKYAIQSCLDCSCGTGWHLFMLDALGLACFGSDISPDMLAAARKNLAEKNIPLKQEDFRTLSRSWSRQFDMIICMTTSLPHMLTDDAVTAALNSMHEVLNPGGIVVISNGISDALLDSRPKFIPARIGADQAFYFFLEYPTPERVVFNILYIKKTAQSFEHRFEVIQYNAMRQSVLARCFSQTPFRRIDYFGGHDLSNYSTEASGRLIAVAQR
jgi:SAM-dependent methyltransferase